PDVVAAAVLPARGRRVPDLRRVAPGGQDARAPVRAPGHALPARLAASMDRAVGGLGGAPAAVAAGPRRVGTRGDAQRALDGPGRRRPLSLATVARDAVLAAPRAGGPARRGRHADVSRGGGHRSRD